MELTNYNRKNNRKALPDLSSMMYGKVPPQAKELEENILGAIMIEKSAFDLVVELLKPEIFYVDAHQRIYRAMLSLSKFNQPIDQLTVIEQLKKEEELDAVGGPYYVTKITRDVVSAANIETWVRVVYEKYMQREIIRISGELIGNAYDDSCSPFELLDNAEKFLYGLSLKNMSKSFVSSAMASMETQVHTERLMLRDEDITGIPTGYSKLDRITYGWQDEDLIILAARPAVGKTAFALNLARNAAVCLKQLILAKVRQPGKHNVAFFSLEMSIRQCTQRIVSAESGVPLDNIMRGKLDPEKWKVLTEDGFNKFSSMGIFIDDTAALTIYQLRAKARALVTKHHVGLIIIDYLQLMSGIENGRADNREQEISKITRDLKGLAKELKVPIIALSQLSREVEKRKSGDKVPQLSDLRESGAIEQDADIVAFIYRPEYYNEVVSTDGDKHQSGETHIKIAKHRNGVLDTVKLIAKLYIQKFEEPTEKDKAQEKKSKFVPMEGDGLPFPEPDNKLHVVIGSKMADDEDYNFET